MPAAKKRPPQSTFYLLAPLTVPAGVAAAWFGYPGVAAAWLVLLVAALVEPAPQLTGPKDRAGFPTPAGAKEQRAVSAHRVASDLRWRLVVPNPDWFPGWPVRLGFVMAVVAGVAATAVPAGEDWYVWVNAAAGFVLAAQVPGSLRRTRTPEDPNPGVRFDSLGRVPSLLPVVVGALAALLLVAFGVAGVLGAKAGTWFVAGLPLPGFAYAAAAGVAAGAGVAYPQWRGTALAAWRDRLRAREEWAVVWEAVLGTKHEPPVMVGRRRVGPDGAQVVVDTIDTPKTLGAAGVRALAEKITQAIPAGMSLAILNAPDVDSQGQVLPGTVHKTKLEMVTWPSESPIDITDPGLDVEAAGLMISAALSRAVDAFGSGGAQYMLLSCEPVHPVPQVEPAPEGWARLWRRGGGAAGAAAADGQPGTPDDADDQPAVSDEQLRMPAVSDEQLRMPAVSDEQLRMPAVWACTFQSRNSLTYIREVYGDLAADTLGDGATLTANPHPANHQQYPGGGVVYAGALDYLLELDPAGLPAPLQQVEHMLTNLYEESRWNARWTGVLKQGANLPEPQFATRSDAVVNGTPLHSLAFTIKQGEQIDDFFSKHEAKLATTLAASPFVSITGFPSPSGVPGDRHPQAFTVRWSDGPIPTSAANLSPGDGPSTYGALSPQGWVLAGHLNAAFDKARLPRPELFEAKPLTTRRSRGHVWQVEMRLHGGVTLADVRKKIGTIMSALGVPWVQVTPGARPQTMRMVLGADYRSATLANPDRDLPMLVDLEFQQAWVDANVVSSQGLVPTLADTATLPRNPQVQVLDFDLPSGITPDRVKAAVPKLRGSTKNEFILTQPGVRGPSSVRLLAAEDDPMPFPAPPDWDYIDATAGDPVIPFASGVDGEPVVIDLREDPHAAVMGTTGAGKSATSQIVTAAVLAKGWDMVVVDVKKEAADFRFAFPWLLATGTEYREAVAVLEAAYAEVRRRVKLNSKHGVGSSFDLPEEVRPNRLIVFLDEFNNLIQMERPAKPVTDEPAEQARYAEQVREMQYKSRIGALTGYIAREARSAGVNLILAGQAFKQDTLKAVPGGGDIKGMLSRVALGKMSYGEYQWATREPDKVPPLGDVVPKGRGIYESQGAPTAIVQSWWAPDTQAVYTEQVRARRAPLTGDETWDLGPYMPAEAEPDVEGAVLDEAPPVLGVDDGVVIDLDDVDIDLGDLDLDDMDLPDTDDTDDTGAEDAAAVPAEDPAGGVFDPVPDPDMEEPDDATATGFSVLLTDDHATLSAATEDRLVWFGVDDPPVPADRVTLAGDGGLFGHPLLELVASWLADNPGADRVVVVSERVGDVDDMGVPVADGLREAAPGSEVTARAPERDPADGPGHGTADTAPEVVPVSRVPQDRLEDFDF